MNSLSFKPAPRPRYSLLTPSVSASPGVAIPSNHLVALVIDDVSLDPDAFEGVEIENSLEGFLNVRINGQETLMPFSGAKRGTTFTFDPKFKNRVAFYGTNEQTKYLAMKLVEIDEEERKVIDFIAKLFDTALSTVASMHPIASGAVALAASLLRIARDFIDDDDQGVFMLEITQALVNDGTLTVRIANAADEGIVNLRLKIFDLGAPAQVDSDLVVRLVGVRINLEDAQDVEAAEAARRISRRTRARTASKPGIRNVRLSRAEALSSINTMRGIVYNHMRTLALEARSGDTHYSFSHRAGDHDARIILRAAQLARVGKKVYQGSGAGLNVPFSLQLALTPDDLPVDEIFAAAKDILKFANTAGARVDIDSRPDWTKKLEESAVGLLTGFLDETLALYNFEGLLRLINGPAPGGANYQLQQPGVIHLYGDAANGWKLPDGNREAYLAAPVNWRGKQVGTIEIALEVQVAA